ncbi:hypothetical protein Enr13x_35870 [Stieleria neptunia]|uniref:Uncharacterized protein n=1 Tax=Stieleria neptunia TaxID=2527979 RepID=A0A518HSA8_9BACT|nr:hypothetical protein [Stieleria neptunia]QDV43729.1 hypothetical protein Enr13x_35870 [Stieleria neptunia]
MNGLPGILELVGIDPSRYDELDVARCVARLGGSMIGRQIVFRDPSRREAAIDVLFQKFGAHAFAWGDALCHRSPQPLEVSHA